MSAVPDSKQKLHELKREAECIQFTLTNTVEDEYPSAKWHELERKILSLSNSIHQQITPDSVRLFSKTELDLARFIDNSYRQMLVVIKAKMQLVSEDLRKFKQREQIKSVYNKL